MTQRWDEVIRRRANGSTANVNALKEGLHSLRAVCLRSFPEFLVDIKQAAIPKGEIGTDISQITYTVRIDRLLVLNKPDEYSLGRTVYGRYTASPRGGRLSATDSW